MEQQCARIVRFHSLWSLCNFLRWTKGQLYWCAMDALKIPFFKWKLRIVFVLSISRFTICLQSINLFNCWKCLNSISFFSFESFNISFSSLCFIFSVRMAWICFSLSRYYQTWLEILLFFYWRHLHIKWTFVKRIAKIYRNILLPRVIKVYCFKNIRDDVLILS